MQKFYDTNALLLLQDEVFKEKFFISYETLRELENIKTSRNKDENVKFQARHMAHLLKDNPDKYEAIGLSAYGWERLEESTNNHYSSDDIILACATALSHENDIIFVTDDVCCYNLARDQYDLQVQGVTENKNEYAGYKSVRLSDEEMAHFYENMSENQFDLFINEYIIIQDKNGNVVDKYCWNGETHRGVYSKPTKSIYFNKIKPKDVYQSLAIDSIMNNTITALTGKAGSGKSLLSLACIMDLIEHGKYERFVVMFNPCKARFVSDMGYYSGDLLDKAMSNSIGNILTTKFGDRYAIDVLLSQNKLKLVSMADCRGMEISDAEILYIPEASNTNIDIMKLCLSRVSSGARVIIEGDPKSQVDMRQYEGRNNGLARAIEAFKGQEEFGHVYLPNVWRSKIAELCELL